MLKCFLVDNEDPDFHEKIKQPGAMWYCPWYVLEGKVHPMLSIHYENDWAGKRAPICVKTPSGSDWVVDQKSSNGDGWTVKGEAPAITCSPSIVVPGYHGFLVDGVFSDPL